MNAVIKFVIDLFHVSFPFVWDEALWEQDCKLLRRYFCQISRDGVNFTKSATTGSPLFLALALRLG